MKIRLMALLFLLFPTYLAALETQPVKVEELIKTTKSWDGSTLPSYQSGQPEITILKITVQPDVELDWHTHPVINAGVVLKGALTILTKEGQTHELSAGDAVVEVIGKIHRGINKGTDPAEIIVFYAGAASTPLTVKSE